MVQAAARHAHLKSSGSISVLSSPGVPLHSDFGEASGSGRESPDVGSAVIESTLDEIRDIDVAERQLLVEDTVEGFAQAGVDSSSDIIEVPSGRGAANTRKRRRVQSSTDDVERTIESREREQSYPPIAYLTTPPIRPYNHFVASDTIEDGG